jgi:hypothetical protein
LENRPRQDSFGFLASLFASKDGFNESFYEELVRALFLADRGEQRSRELAGDLQTVIKQKKYSYRSASARDTSLQR